MDGILNNSILIDVGSGAGAARAGGEETHGDGTKERRVGDGEDAGVTRGKKKKKRNLKCITTPPLVLNLFHSLF